MYIQKETHFTLDSKNKDVAMEHVTGLSFCCLYYSNSHHIHVKKKKALKHELRKTGLKYSHIPQYCCHSLVLGNVQIHTDTEHILKNILITA